MQKNIAFARAVDKQLQQIDNSVHYRLLCSWGQSEKERKRCAVAVNEGNQFFLLLELHFFYHCIILTISFQRVSAASQTHCGWNMWLQLWKEFQKKMWWRSEDLERIWRRWSQYVLKLLQILEIINQSLRYFKTLLKSYY